MNDGDAEMNKPKSPTRELLVLSSTIMVVAVLSACGPTPDNDANSSAPLENATTANKVSKLGEYSGYSEPVYDGYERTSVYVPVRDGTRLAVDIYRPTKNGVVEKKPLPVIWTHTRYTRAYERDGKILTLIETALSQPGWQLQKVISYGYIAATVDIRGAGASFGVRRDFWPLEEAQDAYDITEWFAEQPWSDGNIGMYARSYLGITQYFAAAEKPPHLKAIFPAMAFGDTYHETNPNGVYTGQAFEVWGNQQNPPYEEYKSRNASVAPVDADPDRKMLDEARAEHHANGWNFNEILRAADYRDSKDPTGAPFHEERGAINRVDEISEWGGGIYHRTGWYDGFTSSPIFMYASLENPQKMVIGPWFHDDHHELNVDIEHVRWYDYWLKGIDNGIMDEPAIHYYVMGAPKETAWQSTDVWPLANQVVTPFYLQGETSGSVNSVNDGSLSTSGPGEQGSDNFTVDYDASTLR